MALTQAQKALWERARAAGAGGQAVGIDDAACLYLLTRAVIDLGLSDQFPELPNATWPLYDKGRPSAQRLSTEVPGITIFERLVALRPDADTYFSCLASIHRARLKYDIILSLQPMPTLEQVGPRSLLQFGRVNTEALISLLFWRKWFFDIDNRAGQETGYLFEPVISSAIGGTPVPAKRSPVRRTRDRSKGRQVDCIIGDRAYELKIRVTIAASGQGRWREELDFPEDCRASGYTPVLVVLDGTDNPKLRELTAAFLANGGVVYIGDQAWAHLDQLAGPTMAVFLETYVRGPLEQLQESPLLLPHDLHATVQGSSLKLTIGTDMLSIDRLIVADSSGLLEAEFLDPQEE